MNIKGKLSTNPLHYVYALVWFGIFAYFACYIFSGQIFRPDDNGKIHIVGIMVAWVVQFLTQVGTGILVLLIGLLVAYKTVLKLRIKTMQINYLMLSFTGLFLAGTIVHYKYARAKGMVFRYKPIMLLIFLVLFLLSLYAIIMKKPYNEVLPFIR